MIPLEAAIPQVLRFSGCPGWPESREGQNELAHIMAKVAANPAHSVAIAEAWQEQSRWAPTAHDFIELARRTAPPTDDTATRPFCSLCGGSGWLPLPPREFRGRIYSSVKPCGCRRPKGKDHEQPTRLAQPPCKS